MFWNLRKKQQQEISRLGKDVAEQQKKLEEQQKKLAALQTELSVQRKLNQSLVAESKKIESEKVTLENALLSQEALCAIIGQHSDPLMTLAAYAINHLLVQERKQIPPQGHYETKRVVCGGHHETVTDEVWGSACHETVLISSSSREVWVDDYVDEKYWVETSPALDYYETNSLLGQAMNLVRRDSADYQDKLQSKLVLPLQAIWQAFEKDRQASVH